MATLLAQEALSAPELAGGFLLWDHLALRVPGLSTGLDVTDQFIEIDLSENPNVTITLNGFPVVLVRHHEDGPLDIPRTNVNVIDSPRSQVALLRNNRPT